MVLANKKPNYGKMDNMETLENDVFEIIANNAISNEYEDIENIFFDENYEAVNAFNNFLSR